jgi:hypothetical protein
MISVSFVLLFGPRIFVFLFFSSLSIGRSRLFQIGWIISDLCIGVFRARMTAVWERSLDVLALIPSDDLHNHTDTAIHRMYMNQLGMRGRMRYKRLGLN